MKAIYESPVAEVVNFTALEQLATLENEVRLAFGNDNFDASVGSRIGF